MAWWEDSNALCYTCLSPELTSLGVSHSKTQTREWSLSAVESLEFIARLETCDKFEFALVSSTTENPLNRRLSAIVDLRSKLNQKSTYAPDPGFH